MAVAIPKEGRQVESRSDWATPKAVFDIINLTFGPFTLDPCASAENAKCPTYFTKDQDGLTQSWKGHRRVYCNPEYGRELPKWAAKTVQEARENEVTTVFLIPPRVGSAWFQDLCDYASELVFLRGRVAFIDPAGNRTSPMDDNCVVVIEPGYGPNLPASLHVLFWDWKADIRKHLGEEAYRSVGGRK